MVDPCRRGEQGELSARDRGLARSRTQEWGMGKQLDPMIEGVDQDS